MLKKHTNPWLYLSICLGCFLMSLGLCILIDSSFESLLNVKKIILQILIITLMMTVLFFNRRIAILGGIACAAAFLYFAYTLKILNQDGFLSFFNWCSSGMPQNSDWYSPEKLTIIHTFINFGICSLLFLSGLTPYRSRLAALICIALISAVYAVAFVKFSRIVIVLIFTGVFSVCAVDKFEHRKHIGGKKKFAVSGKHRIIPVFSIILCFLISGSTVICLDNDKKYDLRNRTCSYIAADVQSFTGVYTNEQKNFGMSLYDLGLQGTKEYIGGDLPVGKHTLLALTDLNSSFNVKLTTFDTFTGKEWKTGFQDNYRINGPFSREQKRYLANNILKKSYVSALKNAVSMKKVKFVLNVDSVFLPTIGQTYRFSENSETKNPNLFNMSGQLFSYFGQNRGYSYTLDTIHFNTTADLTEKDMFILRSLSAKRDSIYTKDFLNRYTACSVKFGEKINEIIKLMKLDPKNKFDTAFKVCNFFTKENGFVYSNTGYKTDGKNNVINELFTTKKGHCVYYSTTAIAILRTLKIPSRLAAGFRTVKYSENVQIVDSFYPYCWVECYFPNLGWVSFDPSPENKIDFTPEHFSFSKKAAKQIEAPKAPKSNEPTFNFSEIGKNSLRFMLSVLVLALIYLISKGFWVSKLYNYKIVVKRFDTTKKQCEFYLRDIERQLSVLGLCKCKGDTLREQMLRAFDALDDQGRALLASVLEISEQLCYANKLPSDEEIYQLSLAHAMLDNTLKKRLNLFIFIVKRRILIPIFTFRIKNRCFLKKYNF